MTERIGPYRVQRQLGEGGMGVVYAAVDDRLDRPVALKWMREALADPVARDRFLREARAAASVNHPRVCPIYALDEHDGRLYIAMELLEGRPLSERLREGRVPPREARGLMLQVLEALDALHARGFVHRDLKPSNVFLTTRGAVLLDFGLARDLREGAATGLTRTGAMVGTPTHMAPEQALGREVDRRTDVFAAGLLLYEMLAGRPAFAGDTTVAVLYAIVNADPPPLPADVAGAYGGVLERSLAKDPARRFPDAGAMAATLATTRDPDETSGGGGSSSSTEVAVRARAMTRLLALPLRVMRPDPDTDYLAYSLPDAAAASLANLESLVVRPSATAARFAGHPLDLEAIARDADVDVVLSGTLMRAGDRLRVNAQLIEVPGGTLLAAHTSEASLTDLFQLEDELTRGVVEALRLPLTAREHRLLGHDVPADPKAYAAYLKANQLMTDPRRWPEARDHYLDSVRADPRYAPAWARLGRAHRVLAKFGDESTSGYASAAQAFDRALELNPDLPAAHQLLTHLEVETGKAVTSIRRLVERLKLRPADPELYGGLVAACRFCGLLDESMKADTLARRLDPFVSTSVAYTLFMRGEYERAMAADQDQPRWLTATVLATLGRTDEAALLLRDVQEIKQSGWRALVRIYLNGWRKDASATLSALEEVRRTSFRDPEGLFLVGRVLAFAGLHDEALDEIARTVRDGFACPSFLRADPWLEPLRARPEFAAVLAEADAIRARGREALEAAGGERLLGAATR